MEGSVYQYYANVRTEPVEWLWYPYIPLGKLTVLQGDPGEGKSTFALNVVARITTGQPMPDGVPAKGKRVAIYQCAEDGIADTIKPRLQQAGADCERVAYIIDKPAVSIRANRMEFSMSAIRLFEGVQHVLPMLSENKKRMVVAICAEEEISSIEWARLKKDKWVNRSISCPEYVQSIYKMMNWNKECRYKIYGRLANSERGLVLVFDLASAVMFDPLPEEYFDKHTGKMKKRIVKYYPDEIRMKLGRSYSDYEALQQRSSFESLSGYMDTSGGAVPATVSEELAASISMQEQEKKRETLFGTIIGNGGDDDVRNNE